jgi:hypothetical protein
MGQLLGAGGDDKPIVELPNLDLTDINVVLLVMFGVFAMQALFSFFRIALFSTVTERAFKRFKVFGFRPLNPLPY